MVCVSEANLKMGWPAAYILSAMIVIVIVVVSLVLDR